MTRQRTLVTEDRIDGFLAKLAARGRRDVAGIRALCLGERNFLKNAKYVKRGDDPDDKRSETTLALTSRHKLLTGYRNAIRERFGENHPALDYMVLSDAEQEERNAAGREAVVARHVDRRPISPDTLIELARESLINRTSIPALAIAAALIVVTGRRPIEILLTGNFKKVRKPDASLFDGTVKKRFSVLFSGQAKTKGAENAQNEAYEIPTLIDPSLIVDAFKYLRRRYNCEGLTPQQVGNRAWKELGKYAKARYRDRDGLAIKPSELRAAYATIAYERLAPMKTSWNAYTARILGHSTNDLVTSFSYDQFYPIGSKREYDREIRSATRETLDALRDQRLHEDDPQKAEYLDQKIVAVTERLESERA